MADTACSINSMPFRLRMGWGLGSLSMSAMFNAVSLLLLTFLIEFVGVPAVTAGALILVSKIYDAVTDPLMGVLSDRTKSRWGRRRPYLMLGGLLAGLSFVMIFTVPTFENQNTTLLYIFVALLLNATAYTVFNVPYLAMPAEMTDSYHERTSLMSFRVSAIAGGQLLSSVIGPVIIAEYGGGLFGHSVMSVAVGIAIIAICTICFWTTHDAKFTVRNTQHSYTFSDQVKLVFENKPFFTLLMVKFTQLFGFSIFIAALPLLFTRTLGVSYAYLGTYYLFQAGATIASQPAWVFLSRKYGKTRCYYVTSIIFAAATISWVFGEAVDPNWHINLRAVFTGLGAGGLLLIGQSLLPDTIEHDFQRTGLRREGVFAGVYTTVEKMSFAFGPALLGILLGTMGWVEAQGGVQVEQSSQALMAIDIAMIIPTVTLAFSCYCLSRYSLTESALRDGAAANS
jgi:GPH family glycoside/pentoside/hexuronide:cation symporter